MCVTSQTLRAVETAQIVAHTLSIPVVQTSRLDDPPAGVFEDGPVEAFAKWLSKSEPDTLVPGTANTLRESARRYLDATKMLMTRPERAVLVVAHAPALRWIVQAAENRTNPLNYRRPLLSFAVPIAVDVVELRSRLEALAIDPYSVLAGTPAPEALEQTRRRPSVPRQRAPS